MSEYKETLDDLKQLQTKLEDRLTKLKAVISGLKELAAEGRPVATVSGAAISYRGKTMLDAAYKCLETNRNEPMKSREIAEELKAGGFKSKSKNLPRLLYNVLYKDDRFTSKDGKWSIEEHTYVANWGMKRGA